MYESKAVGVAWVEDQEIVLPLQMCIMSVMGSLLLLVLPTSSVSRMQESADVSCTCKHHLLVGWMEPACFQLSREVLVFPSMMGSSLGLTDWFP